MNAKVETVGYQFDIVKWIVVAGLVIGGVVANSYYAGDVALLYRVLALVALGIVASVIAVNTEKGHAFWELLKASQIEIRKVVWPTRQETIQTTLLVLAVVIIMAVILWVLDYLMGLGASKIIG